MRICGLNLRLEFVAKNFKNCVSFFEFFAKIQRNSAKFAKTLTQILSPLSLAFFFVACGYLPTSKVASNVFSDKIYVYVSISQQDARNSIYIVDTVRELIINKLDKSPANKDEADDSLYVNMQSLSFIPIIYDEYGYVIAYKTRIVLAFEAHFKDGRKEKITTSGDYDFDISPNSAISETARFNAIKNASSEAFDEFVSIISMRGLKWQTSTN